MPKMGPRLHLIRAKKVGAGILQLRAMIECERRKFAHECWRENFQLNSANSLHIYLVKDTKRRTTFALKAISHYNRCIAYSHCCSI